MEKTALSLTVLEIRPFYHRPVRSRRIWTERVTNLGCYLRLDVNYFRPKFLNHKNRNRDLKGAGVFRSGSLDAKNITPQVRFWRKGGLCNFQAEPGGMCNRVVLIWLHRC